MAHPGTLELAGCAAHVEEPWGNAAELGALVCSSGRPHGFGPILHSPSHLAYRLLVERRMTMQGEVEIQRATWPNTTAPGPRLWSAPPADAQPLMVGGMRRGYIWHDEIGEFCLITDVAPVLANASRTVQSMMVFDQLEALLERAGFTFDQVLRTWFFLDDIHSWYSDFNRVRTKFYSERGLLGRSPASTAVGVSNEQRSAVKAQLIALRPNGCEVVVSVGDSPLQGAAFDYGSAFSRAMRLDWPKGMRLYVSGTASIDSAGRTLFAKDSQRQIQETFRVVRALLEHHGLGLRDVKLATAYLPNPGEERLVRAIWEQHLELAYSRLRADICRPDLHFELELMAERGPC